MKKISALLLFSLLAFSACAGPNTDVIRMQIQDLMVSDVVSYGDRFTIEPNYEDRTLNVVYTIVDESGESNYEGLVGGEFFDSFQNIVDDYENGAYKKFETSTDAKSMIYNVYFDFVDGKQHQAVNFLYDQKSDLPKELEPFRKLVDDIASLLLTEAPV